MPRELRDSVVVITGASSGIGRATARTFAGAGAKVVLAARSEDSLREVAGECEALGGQALVVPTDVADEEAVRELARRTAQRFGRIDVWVNNAGVIAYGHFEQIPAKTYLRVIETNLFGQIHGAHAVLPHFREQGYGTLINVASLWGTMPSPYVSAYVTSKFGVRAFSESLRMGLASDKDIHVCTISPESVDTPIFRHAANYTGRAVRPVPPIIDPERVVKAILRCARNPKREVIVGQSGHVLRIAYKVAPGLFDRIVSLVFERSVFRSELAEPGPGNVFEPMPRWNRITGEWRTDKTAALRRIALLAGGAVLVPLVTRRMVRRRG